MEKDPKQSRHGRWHALAIGIASWLVTFTAIPLIASAQSNAGLARRATWTQPEIAEVRTQVLEMVAQMDLPTETIEKIHALWPETLDLPRGVELLEHFGNTAAILSDEAGPLVKLIRVPKPVGPPPMFDFLTREETPVAVRHNLRLLYGRWLVQNRLYDEATEVLAGLNPEDVVDPATLLFVVSMTRHALLQKEECLAAAQKLLENESEIPRRYAAVAQLAIADIQGLKKDSLDEIARMMDDIQRRLDLHRAGARVRSEEDAVIAKLDKMIEEMEKNSKSASMSSQNSAKSSKPAEQSRALGGRGAGDVDPKQMSNETDWGNLPPKERAEALQQVARDLPVHFREIIEEYFRKLAQDREP